MNEISKRELLWALTGLAGTYALPAAAQTQDFAAAGVIGEAFMAAQPHTDLRALAAEWMPNGFREDALPALRARVAADYRSGAMFNYRGWRLSHTEGALFALLART